MKSVNYVAGVAGWRISRDGSAEFSNVTIRGEFDLGAGGPGTARIIMSQNLPAPLNTFTWTNAVYGANTYHYTEGFIIYGPGDDTTYQYICQVSQSSSPAGSRIVHFGQVVGGAVLVDSNGNPKVQEWNYQSVSPNMHHLFHSDEFQAEVLDSFGKSNRVGVSVGSVALVTETVGGTAGVTGQAAVSIDTLAGAGSVGLGGVASQVVVGSPLNVNSQYQIDASRIWVITDRQYAACSTLLNVPSAAPTLVTGLQFTVTTVRANASVDITMFLDWLDLIASATTSVAWFYVDGVQLASPQCIWAGQTLNLRTTPGQQTTVIIATPGSHTIEVRAQNVGGSSTAHRISALHSTLSAQVNER
jgi:hypothetical protein